MKGINKIAVVLTTVGLLASASAHATLFDRGGGLIYDNVLDITWLQDANYAKTSGYDADGRMDWAAAKAWAANLNYGGFDDWRLPTALNQDGTGPCLGWNCTGSEMGELFYTEGSLSAGQSILADPPGILDDFFINMQSSFDPYWSSTDFAPNTQHAWNFYTVHGQQNAGFKTIENYAWAVRDGDVATAVAVSEPMSLVLLGAGLVGLALGRRRRSFDAS